MGIGFSASERALIAESFREISADLPAATDCFYRHLFRVAPETRDLFVLDLDRQGAKLAQTLATVVAQTDRWGLLRGTLGDLAIRHLAYGVQREHYAATEEALLAMLRERLGPRFAPEAERAWRRLVAAVNESMIEAAYPPAVMAGED